MNILKLKMIWLLQSKKYEWAFASIFIQLKRIKDCVKALNCIAMNTSFNSYILQNRGDLQMSMGIGAYADKILEDEKTVIYQYGSYNLNDPNSGNEQRKCDGGITVLKSCFAEPEIHEKIKRTPGGRKKLIVKRIPVKVDYPKMIEDGSVEIENCTKCWQTAGDEKKTDIMALHILFPLFQKYQETGEIPEHIGYDA